MKKRIYWLIGLVGGIIAILIYRYTVLFDSLELMMKDGMFSLRNEPPVITEEGTVPPNPRLNPRIVIIGIDDRALQKFGRWPWPRRVHAKFLSRLVRAKPAAVFFDIFFVEPSPRDDAIFTSTIKWAVRKGIKVYVDYPMDIKPQSTEIKDLQLRLKYLDQKALPAIPGTELMREFNFAIPPLPGYLKSAYGWGMATILQDHDGKYRKLPLFGLFKEKLYPHIIFQLALDYFQVSKENIEIVPGEYVKLKNAKIPVLDEFGDIVDYKVEDITIPVDEECRMDINFVGYPKEFYAQGQYYSYADVFEMDPESFTGKYLFVGAYAQGMAHDIWASPHGNMYGIEFNANAFNTIIQRDFFKQFPLNLNLLLILLISTLVGFIASRLKIWQSGILFVVILISTVIFAYSMFLKNIIVLYFTPIAAVILSFLLSILYRILVEEKEKRFIKARFANYVSPKVVDELLKNPKMLELGGEDRIITVFFSDIRGFTTISEKLGEPQKLVRILNEYLSAMTDIILAYDGTLDKYVGDEIMAFWGAPTYQPDHAYLACKAALAQAMYLYKVLHPKWEREGKPLLRVGMGINTGKMTVGNMGSKRRMDYTLIGDEVNLGARLEGLNKIYGTTIIISESTYEYVKDKVIARELDITRVKGKLKPVRIYELMGLKEEEIKLENLKKIVKPVA